MKEGGSGVGIGGAIGAGGLSEVNKGAVGSGPQASSPSSTSQQPNPNPNLDSNLIKWKRL